jgi:hypothetical protein
MNRFGAYAFGAYAAQTVKAGSSSVIKMIQQGSITIASGSASNTYTVSPAISNTANAIIILGGFTTSNNTAAEDRDSAILVITNSTTITATRGIAPAFVVTLNFTIIEFASGVNSIQAGTIAFGTSTASATATISTVGANAFVLFNGSNDSGSEVSSFMLAGVTLTNSTTVTAFVNSSATITQNVRYMVVDLDATIVTGVQKFSTSMTSSSASDTDTLTSVVAANTALMWGGIVTGSAAVFSGTAYNLFLTNATTVTKTRIGINSAARTAYYTAVTFAASALNSSIQRTNSALSMSSASSATWTITSVNTAKAFVNWNGFSATSASPNVVEPSITLASATTVTAAINSSGSSNPSAEVIEFK